MGQGVVILPGFDHGDFDWRIGIARHSKSEHGPESQQRFAWLAAFQFIEQIAIGVGVVNAALKFTNARDKSPALFESIDQPGGPFILRRKQTNTEKGTDAQSIVTTAAISLQF